MRPMLLSDNGSDWPLRSSAAQGGATFACRMYQATRAAGLVWGVVRAACASGDLRDN
jgi:hypothetical protein